jgi:hypothetical protein
MKKIPLTQVKNVNIFARNPQVRRVVAELNSYQCSFPRCTQELLIDGTFIGEVASIEALQSSGPRYNERTDISFLTSEENHLLLCPNHHRIVDGQPSVYTTQWLKKARVDHLSKVRAALSEKNSLEKFKIPQDVELSLSGALDIWNKASHNETEEFWQQLFHRCPAVIAQLFPRSMVQFGSKCYVGGKSVQNDKGNLVDFVYANPATNNVVLIEIKTPATPLIGKHYRKNAFAMSDELSGSIVQVLNYRDSLIKEYYSLGKADHDSPFNVFSPKCVVIVGNVQKELVTPLQRRSFELFRGELAGTEIVGYDELFEKIECVLDVAK